MKRSLLLACCLISALCFSQNKTTIASGAWTNPAIWFPAGVPTGGETNILINHQVTFTGILPLGPDSLLITANGCLSGSSGSDTLTTGATDFANYGGISVAEFQTSDNFLNYGRVKVTGDFNQGGNCWNYSGGKFDVGILFNTTDSLLNDGEIKCAYWSNNAPTAGTGKFCIANCFINTDVIGGTLDICDATPMNICDVNTGTIAPSVTYCTASPCSGISVACSPSSTDDFVHEKVNVSVFPNPSTGTFHVRVDDHDLKFMKITVYDLTGKIVLKQSFNSNKGQIKLSGELNGMFFVEVSDAEDRVIVTKKLIVH